MIVSVCPLPAREEETVTHDEFIGQVQQRARLSSRGDVERATRVVLETLAERLAGGQPKDLAAQLPPRLGRHLLHVRAGTGEPFSLDDFFALVSVREGGDLPDAVHQARAVLAVLQEAVSPGEIEDVRSQLPRDFDRLFTAGSEGALPRQ
jgi:uncharacterized protein (DUF2267 family)